MGLLDAAAGLAATAASALGGSSSAPLAKLTIQVEGDDPNNPFQNAKPALEVFFNPATLRRQRSVTWRDTGSTDHRQRLLHFTEAPLMDLQMDLLFDTTEPASDGKPLEKMVDVRDQTQVVVQLTYLKQDAHRPPFCNLIWGRADKGGQYWFTGVATSIAEEFTFFARDGTPLRAKLACHFKGWVEAKNTTATESHSNDLNKSYVVQRGDTLASIARDQMHDGALWRSIAVKNGITDPLSLIPGRVLDIPMAERR